MSLHHLRGDSSLISLDSVSVNFGAGKTAVQALSGINSRIEPGEFVSIIGPSGCGKSTIVGAIAGFTPVSAGRIRINGQPIQHPGPDRGVVFQQHALFPWKTVEKNVEFGLKMRGMRQADRRELARTMLAKVGLSDFLHHYPHQLSGGMQQRVNLARVLVNQPRILLMDEPFCSLDAQTRLSMQDLLQSLWNDQRMTVIFVTHDIDEALYLSDRVIVLTQRPGRIKDEVEVSLPRPRNNSVLVSQAFMDAKRYIMELLRIELQVEAAALTD